MNRCLTLGLLLVCITAVLAQYPTRKPKVPEVDETCMNCLCQASSNCDETLKCHNSGGGGYFCGPYVISWAYWYDGGRPGDKGRAHDFETCLSNKTCAEQAVRGYMRKYGRDCDGNHVIDCYDFARIHKLGFGSCSNDIDNTDYYEKFQICYGGYEPGYDQNDGSYGDDAYNNGGGYVNDANIDRNDGGYVDDTNQGSQGGDFQDYGEGHINARNGQQG